MSERKVGVEVSAVKREEGRGERCQQELDAEVLAMATVKARGERGWRCHPREALACWATGGRKGKERIEAEAGF